MTAQQDPYVRVYYRVIDDPKFADVYDDDARFACWVRLLLIADGTYPAPAPIPHGVKRAAFSHLVKVGLIDLEPGNRYRIHGMDAERGARSKRAADAAAESWRKRRGDAPAMQTHSGSNASASAANMHSAPIRSEPNQSAPLRAEPTRAPSGDAYDVMLKVEALTRRPFNYREGHQIHDTLVGDVAAHGAEKMAEHYARFQAENGRCDTAQLVFGVHNALHPLIKAKPMTEAERKEAEIAAAIAQIKAETAGATA